MKLRRFRTYDQKYLVAAEGDPLPSRPPYVGAAGLVNRAKMKSSDGLIIYSAGVTERYSICYSK